MDGNIGIPMSLSDYLNTLQGYNLNAQTDSLLELGRAILDSNNYKWMGVPFPTGDNVNFGNLQEFSGSISIPPNSYLISIGGYSSSLEAGQAGFKFSVYDKGSNAYIANPRFMLDRVAAGNGVDQINSGINQGNTLSPLVNTDPYGAYMLRSPYVILPPGTLQVAITNLDNTLVGNATDTIQLFFAFAVPVGGIPQQ